MRCEKTGVDDCEDPTVAEMNLGYGCIAYLCYRAKQAWLKFIMQNGIANDLEVMEAKLFAHTCKLKRGLDVDVRYIADLRQRQDMEKQYIEVVTEWLNTPLED